MASHDHFVGMSVIDALIGSKRIVDLELLQPQNDSPACRFDREVDVQIDG